MGTESQILGWSVDQLQGRLVLRGGGRDGSKESILLVEVFVTDVVLFAD